MNLTESLAAYRTARHQALLTRKVARLIPGRDNRRSGELGLVRALEYRREYFAARERARAAARRWVRNPSLVALESQRDAALSLQAAAARRGDSIAEQAARRCAIILADAIADTRENP